MLSSEIKDFIFQFVLIILLTTILLLIFPNGKIKNTVKIVFSIIIVVFLINGIKLNKNNYSIDYSLGEKTSNYFIYLQAKREESCIKTINDIIENPSLIKNIDIMFEDCAYDINEIEIHLQKDVQFTNDYLEKIKLTIAEKLLIIKDKVLIYVE